MKLDHINIAAPPQLLRRTRDFYCEILGLEQGFRPDFRVRGYWLYSDDHAAIHLVESGEDTEPATDRDTGYLDHIAFRVEDPAPILANLERHDIQHTLRTVPGTEVRQVFFRDPAGTRLEISFEQPAPADDR